MSATQPFSRNRFLQSIIAGYTLVWIATAVMPRDGPTWALENLPVVIFIAFLARTWRRFQFTARSYLLIAIFLSLHAVGAHTGYAHSPAGDWLRSVFNLRRNPYDRVIHCAFGLLLAYPVRELLVCTGDVRGRAAFWLPVSLILAASVCFEVLESAVASIVSPGTGPAWLGAQGDEWDAQLDMGVALAGALATMLLVWCLERTASPRVAPS